MWSKWIKSGVLVATIALGGALPAMAEEDAPPPRGERPLAGPRPDGQGQGERRKFGGGEMRPDHRRPIARELFANLDLNDEQKEKIKAIHEEGREAREKYKQEHQDEFRALREQMRDARQNKDEAKIKELRAKMKALVEGMPAKPKDLHEKVLTVLNPEQREQFEKNIQEMKKKARERREQMGDGKGDRKGEGDRPMPRKRQEERRKQAPEGEKKPEGGGLEL